MKSECPGEQHYMSQRCILGRRLGTDVRKWHVLRGFDMMGRCILHAIKEPAPKNKCRLCSLTRPAIISHGLSHFASIYKHKMTNNRNNKLAKPTLLCDRWGNFFDGPSAAPFPHLSPPFRGCTRGKMSNEDFFVHLPSLLRRRTSERMRRIARVFCTRRETRYIGRPHYEGEGICPT